MIAPFHYPFVLLAGIVTDLEIVVWMNHEFLLLWGLVGNLVRREGRMRCTCLLLKMAVGVDEITVTTLWLFWEFGDLASVMEMDLRLSVL